MMRLPSVSSSSEEAGKTEIGNQKLENGNWKIEAGNRESRPS
jgi:hypothetical protein